MLFGLITKEKIAVKILAGQYRDGLAGKKGKGVMEALKKLQGVRSAIVLLILIVEGVAQHFGFSAGPVFSILHGLFATIGWDEAKAIAEIGIDPAQLLVYVFGIYAAVKRIIAWAESKKAAPEPAK